MNRSLIVANFLAFIYYSEYGFEDFFIGYTDDPSILFRNEGMIRTSDNFKILKAESGDAVNYVVNYFKDLGCEGSSVPVEIDRGYVYVYLKTAQTVV